MKEDAAAGNVAITIDSTEVRSSEFHQYLLSFRAEYVITSREISICCGPTAICALQPLGTSFFVLSHILCFCSSRVAVHNSVDRIRSSRMISPLIYKFKMIKLTFELRSKLLSSQFVLLSIVLSLKIESGESNGP